jgi:phosphotransferase system HPr (HPr) family protein
MSGDRPGADAPEPNPNANGSEPLRRKVRIANPQGFHLRPLTAFVQAALRFQSAVHVRKQDQRVNGKSALELMLLAAEQGTELELEVSGSDAAQALSVLSEILAAESMPDPPEAAG